MKTQYFILLMVLSISFSACKKEEAITGKVELKHLNLDAAGKSTVLANNDFAINLYKKTALNSNDNMMISPLSISLALGMTYNGAAGTTKTAMETAMCLNGLTSQDINNSFKVLSDYLQTVDPTVTMKIANSIWYRDDFTVLQNFLNLNTQYYDALIKSVDFSDPATKALINKWVADNTNNKILKIVDNINPNDVMFLINAVYFLGNWTYQFDPAKTSQESFTMSNSSVKTVDMMEITSNFMYLSNNLMQIVELPYGGERYSMILMKPLPNYTCDDLLNAFSTSNFNAWINAMNPTDDLLVKLPKFKFEYEKKLNDILTDLGMGVAFTSQADFTNINAAGNLFISRVKHKTFIDVNEKGTEAAAVTSVGITFTSMPDAFIADKPFLFIIREKESNALIFMGKVEEPKY
ncbi:MAG: serpin family protein [Saprospiraceae bacterium]|nr:serpin family protein [Saprospiraceae bacterium]